MKQGKIIILFVCSENTCRSPMIAAMAQYALDLEYSGRFQCLSAGIDAGYQRDIIQHAKDAVKEISYGEITSTHSQSLEDIDLETVDLIVPADEFKGIVIKSEHPDLKDKVEFLLEIPDPFDLAGFPEIMKADFKQRTAEALSEEERKIIKYEQYKYVASVIRDKFIPVFLEKINSYCIKPNFSPTKLKETEPLKENLNNPSL
jgi:protein-tyrosine-phosphatase